MEQKQRENLTNTANIKSYSSYSKFKMFFKEKISYIIEKCLSSDEILITKKTKKGIEKTINYRNSLKEIEIKDDGLLSFILKAGQNEQIPALRADEFLETIFGESNIFKIKRVKFFDTDMRVI
jgi:hypothetical protein